MKKIKSAYEAEIKKATRELYSLRKRNCDKEAKLIRGMKDDSEFNKYKELRDENFTKEMKARKLLIDLYCKSLENLRTRL